MNEQALVPYKAEQIDLIKQTVAKGVTDLELKLFLYQAQRTGLDPLSKQIHAIKRWSYKSNKEEMAIQTGIDGYRLIADRTGQYAGSDDPLFDDETAPKKATVTVWKLVKDIKCSFSASARWSEYYPGEKQGFMWKTKPCIMLGKCAEALALRKAFPQELSGVYTHEEMAQAGESIDIKEEPKEKENVQEEIGYIQSESEDKSAQPEKYESHKPVYPATDKQKKMIFARLKGIGVISTEDMQNFALEKCGKTHSKDWTGEDIQTLVDAIGRQAPDRQTGEGDS
ncbi:MAG: phage recombination protein Bet [bacterium]